MSKVKKMWWKDVQDLGQVSNQGKPLGEWENLVPCIASLGWLPSYEEETEAFKFDLGEQFCKDICPIVIGVYFNDLDSSVKDLITKMMELDG